MSFYLIGLLTGLSLIVAIGAQNAYILRLGLSEPGRVVAPVVGFCIASDAALIVAGVAGLGVLTARAPWLLTTLRWVGVAWLIGYALLSARRSLAGARAQRAGQGSTDPLTGAAPVPGVNAGPTLFRALLTVAAFTWLNPHVYLDTMLLIGSLANAHPTGRWWVAGGAITASIAWFIALSAGARLLRPLLRRPLTWPVIDGTIAATMGVLALRLALH
ncbi:LysE/ArgO family amino acid transporter [Branchiibius cervicis]|uniref:LysE/ArgO family amino acid transporter n=1 Tax=Branchiibius cervicis TaxID=908252 RepID=A0ABW2AN91_9MICO